MKTASDTLRHVFYDDEDSDNICHLCGNADYTLFKHVTLYEFPFSFKRCQCGMIKQTPMPNEKFFDWFFNSDLFFSSKHANKDRIWGFYDYFKDENCRMATSRRRYRMLSDHIGADSPKQIMKIGPSTGTFLYVAKQHGHMVRGCDISTRFSEYAKEKYDVDIDIGRYERMDYPDQSFDALLLFNVIENVPNLFEFLDAIRRTIKVGGHFILNHVEMSGNLLEKLQGQKYFMYRPPICYMLDSPVLKRLLGNYGMEIVTSMRDIRYMHLEKILTLLGWKAPLKIAEALGIQNVPFPIYAYPSHITIARRIT